MIRSLVMMKSALEEGKKNTYRNLSREALAEHLTLDCVMWIDVVDPTSDEISWLAETLDIHPAVVSDLKRADRRPTLLTYPGYTFLSLFQPLIKAEELHGAEVHCLCGENYLITVRKSESSAVEAGYNDAARIIEQWNDDPYELLYMCTQHVIDSYYPLMDRLSTQLDDIEEGILIADGAAGIQMPLYRIKRYLVRLRQMVAPQREVLSSLIGEARLAMGPTTREMFQHLYERLLRVYDLIDGQRDLWSNILELVRSRETERLTRVVNRLTVISMIFLPLTFILGVFELNFVTTSPVLAIPVPGAWMLAFLMAGMLLIAGLMFWLYRRVGWV